MTTYLLKTEPSEYSFADLVRDGVTAWSGVSNPAAVNTMREMKPGDEAFIYHTGDERAVVGLARVTSAARVDPKRREMDSKGRPKYVVVDVEPVRAAARPVSLATIKADARFAGLALVTQGRLSVMPVPAAMAKALRAMAGL